MKNVFERLHKLELLLCCLRGSKEMKRLLTPVLLKIIASANEMSISCGTEMRS